MQLQYIGARYIPIFYQNSVDQTANWEINVEYEPLTFVTTQNNHLYLSKKTVPDNIGTPAQNTEYWLDMGIFTDAQIAEVVERVDALEEEYGTLTETTIPEISQAIEALTGTVGEHTEAIEDIEEDTAKRNPFDFGLWFTNSKFDNQELQWDSPWGRGYPGWHIECSGISIKNLGEKLDIHCGAEDAIFPHHTNEIAQSESYLGHKWCNYWVHLGFLNDETGKMSKSKGEFLTVSLLEEKGYNPLAYRYLCLNSYYHSQLTFSYDILDGAQNAYNKLYEKYYNLVYAIVFSILKNKDDSEDITHEIFTKIYKLDVNKLPTNNESSWLFTVSKNECYLYLRKSKPNINIEEIYEIPESSNDIDKIIDIEYYNKLIKGLKEDEKLIVSLKVLSNFTFNKISQVMNIPIGTVQWKYYNAINSLKVSVSSLVGAVIAFVVVIARGEMLNSKTYLNAQEENKDKDENDIVQDDENVTNEESEIPGGNESLKENDSLKDNQSSEEKDSQQNNIEINGGTQNIVQPDNQTSTDKNEQNTENIKQEISQSVTNLSEVKTNKLDSFQVIFTSIGITFLIIFITFLDKSYLLLSFIRKPLSSKFPLKIFCSLYKTIINFLSEVDKT